MGEAIVVGRIGRPHGVRGEVTIDVRTDVPERRFAPGVTVTCEPATAGPLLVDGAHWHSGRLLLSFAGVDSREAAEALRGVLLTIDSSEAGPAGDDDEGDDDVWWDRDLIGLSAYTTDGSLLGTVADVVHAPGGDLLVVARPDEGEHLVPFVHEIVPEVDQTNGRLVVDPPAGLLDLG